MCTPPIFKRKVFITSVSLEADNHLFPVGRLGCECLSICQSHGCFSPRLQVGAGLGHREWMKVQNGGEPS